VTGHRNPRFPSAWRQGLAASTHPTAWVGDVPG
jgi:hypothetical protein